MNAPRLICRSEHVLSSDVAGETVLLDTKNDAYLTFNSSASLIWNALEQPADEETLVAFLLNHLDVAEQTARSDVARLIDELSDLGLVAINCSAEQ